MSSEASSYRPHNPGHDYYAPGIYLITLVVRRREDNHTLFGTFNDDLRQPAVALNELGKAVEECWRRIPEMQARRGRRVAVLTACCMPDHFHGVIEVKERMEVSLGEVIRGFKAGCTMAWHALAERPNMVAPAMGTAGSAAAGAGQGSQPYLDERERLKRMSKKQRAAYYAEHPEARQPLWDDNYDDTICLSDPVTGIYDQRHLGAMLRYVADNPRRAILRRLRPDFMQRCLCLQLQVTDVSGRPVTDASGKPLVRRYGAFGNFNLLRWVRKVQVMCHRRATFGMLTEAERQSFGIRYTALDDTKTHVPYERTEHFRVECRRWKKQVMAGQTVIVTPGISMGEQLIKNRCLESRYPLIHLQKEPIGRYWKPEARRFEACTAGSLLILAPWDADTLGDIHGIPSATDYSIFHNLNGLASEICLFFGEPIMVL